MAKEPTPKTPAKARAAGASKDSNNFHSAKEWLQMSFYAIWSVVGLIIILTLAIGMFSGESLLDMGSNTPETEQVTPPPQTSQPTQEQISCIADEVGDERFNELNQGQPAEEEEMAVIQQCLAQ